MMSSAHTDAGLDRLADNENTARVGADLRAARERLGWALEDVAEGLRIRRPYLEALEDGRVSALPGSAYAVGFLRTYASSLGLDPDEMARVLKDTGMGSARRTELSFPAPAPERGIPAGAMLLLATLLTIGTYVGWYHLSGEGRLPAEVVAPVPERLAPLAEQAIPLPPQPPPSPPPAAGSAAHIPSAASAAAASTPLASVPVASPPISPAQIAPSSAAAAITPTVPPSVAPAEVQPAAPAAAALSGDEPRLVLHAKSDAWVQVRAKGGPVLLNKILKTGESWPVPAQPGLLLNTGNAGGTELLVDGAPAPPLGPPGSVKRDIVLDPDALKANATAAAQPPGSGSPAAAASPAATPASGGASSASAVPAAAKPVWRPRKPVPSAAAATDRSPANSVSSSPE